MSDPGDARRREIGRALLWVGILTVVTLGMLSVRPQLEKAHIALVFLLVVLGGSAVVGRGTGLFLAGAAFLLFNYLFLPPYYTLLINNPLDWLVLATFLVTSIVATQLLYRARREADEARRRTAEIDRLASLGAETLNVGRADEALPAIAEVIRGTLGLDACDIFVRAPDGGALTLVTQVADNRDRSSGGLVEWVAENGRLVVELRDGTTHLGPRLGLGDASSPPDLALAQRLLLPLEVRHRTVGVLQVTDPTFEGFGASSWRILLALSFYAALGIERVRLAAEAEHAAALRETDRLKDALLASVSHDLRTPLTTIKALAHEIRLTGDDRAATIEEQADRLNRLVADLLDLSRLNAGVLSLRLELNLAEDLVGAAADQVSGILGSRRLEVKLDSTGELLIGRFDFVHALRVLVNLLENGVKYSPSGAPIVLRVARAGPSLCFEVEDRGPGIPPADREGIFAPFRRAAASTPDVGGAGLGLAIARGLARAQGGDVTFAPRDNGGSRFTLRLPAEAAPTVPEEHL
ncbi:MAG: ATP-binding protein [Gemmatimonadota bacterium]